MGSFPNRVYGGFGDEKIVYTVQAGIELQQLMELPDGSLYRFCLTGEALGAGQLCQTPLAIANHDMDLAVAATVAAGVFQFTATLGATAATLDQYAGGYANMNDGPGEGHKYRIQGHAAVASAGVITLNLDEPVAEGLTVTTSLCGLHANPYNGSLLYNTTPDGLPTGFACAELASGEYGWLQTRGWGSTLQAGTAVLGKEGVASLNTTGATDPHVATGDATPGVVLYASPISVAGDYAWGYITIE